MVLFRGWAAREQDFSKSTYSNLLTLVMIVYKWCVPIALEEFICKMYVVFVSKIFQFFCENEYFFFAPYIKLFKLELKK